MIFVGLLTKLLGGLFANVLAVLLPELCDAIILWLKPDVCLDSTLVPETAVDNTLSSLRRLLVAHRYSINMRHRMSKMTNIIMPIINKVRYLSLPLPSPSSAHTVIINDNTRYRLEMSAHFIFGKTIDLNGYILYMMGTGMQLLENLFHIKCVFVCLKLNNNLIF